MVHAFPGIPERLQPEAADVNELISTRISIRNQYTRKEACIGLTRGRIVEIGRASCRERVYVLV